MNAMTRAAMRALGPLPAGHPAVPERRIGVLLVNLGTPDATDYWSMRRYLKEFLSDRRVIETSRLIWWPLLNLIILTTRPGRKGKDYDTIWNKERDEGPLKTITRSQAEKLGAFVAKGGLGDVDPARIVVDWAMRYGNPSIAERMRRQTETALAEADSASKGAERDPVFAVERLVTLIAYRGELPQDSRPKTPTGSAAQR